MGTATPHSPIAAILTPSWISTPGLDGRPEIAYDWDTVASYIGRYDRGQAVNVAVVIGNSALRIGAIGWEDTRPTSAASPTCGPCCARPWRRGLRGLERARLPTRLVRLDR